MLIAGIDVSGNPKEGNYKYVSIVIGTEEGIRSIVKRLGRERIHMSAIKDGRIQSEIISRLRFDNKECVGFCFRIDLSAAINSAIAKTGIKLSNVSKMRIFATAYYAMWSMIQDPIKEFLQRHRYDLHDVAIECDGYMGGFLRTVGLRYSDSGYAYMVADALAWSNNRGWEPEGAIQKVQSRRCNPQGSLRQSGNVAWERNKVSPHSHEPMVMLGSTDPPWDSRRITLLPATRIYSS